ncbi:MAG: tRNA (adenosine(37)-N6)-dimethylallyltransferase MiaA [Desulfuromonadaceae bacterium]|nr:tRNA (adenosine(37)-N6)-dimethylallyltransferase MiaA [Desulfuromonadaceae bacterium]
MNRTFDLLTVLGPTASGKTRLGVELGRKLNGEIISADSRQVYRGMDIGTGKDLEEYGEIPFHLIDIVEPGEEFSLFEFQRRCLEAIRQIRGRGRLPVLVGGTGLYLDAVLRRYRLAEVPVNPALRAELSSLPMEALIQRLLELKPNPHNTTDFRDREHLIRAIEIAAGEKQAAPADLPDFPPVTPLTFGIYWQRETLRKRIEIRLRQRLDQGLIEEVERLRDRGVSFRTLENYGLEYRFVAWFLQGRMDREELFRQLLQAICAFAKRQRTWFGRMERHGIPIHWLEGEKDPCAEALAVIEKNPPP